jgi:hypothetical protein
MRFMISPVPPWVWPTIFTLLDVSSKHGVCQWHSYISCVKRIAHSPEPRRHGRDQTVDQRRVSLCQALHVLVRARPSSMFTPTPFSAATCIPLPSPYTPVHTGTDRGSCATTPIHRNIELGLARVSLAGGVWRLRRIECTGELGVVVADRPRGDIIAIRSVRGGGECSSVECTAGQR